jgi:hypothetical protein
MLPPGHFLLGGVFSAAIAVTGTLLNALALVVLADSKLSSNPTTVLVIFLTISNTIYTALVLPFNSVTLLKPHWFETHDGQCRFFAYIFYLNTVVKILLETALAINRWATVCTSSCR